MWDPDPHRGPESVRWFVWLAFPETHMSMHRTLVQTPADYANWASAHQGMYGSPTNKDPEPSEYPCMIIWQEQDNPNGRDFLDYEFITRSDLPGVPTHMTEDDFAMIEEASANYGVGDK